MKILRTAADMEIEIICAFPEALITELTQNGITLKEIQLDRMLTIRCVLSVSNYRKLETLCKKRDIAINVLNKSLLQNIADNICRRKFLIVCVILLLSTLWFIPTRVLFIEIEGNTTIPVEQILEKSASCGISFGAPTKFIRSEKFKNELLHRIPGLSWAGVNIRGCVAVISVKEDEKFTDMNAATHQVSSIVATRDGVINSMTVLRGTPVCSIGSAVKKGQLLVSGYTDCGIAITATDANAEVYAETKYNLSVLIPHAPVIKRNACGFHTNYAIIIGKKFINLSQDSGIYDTTCDKIYRCNYLTLPGGFQLPLGLVREAITYHHTDTHSTRPDHNHGNWVFEFTQKYLLQSMISGRILHSEQQIMNAQDYCKMNYDISCVEMIGKIHSEEIIEYHGKTD